MSTFLERIRARNRRINARRAKRTGQAPRPMARPLEAAKRTAVPWLSSADDVDLGAVAAGDQPTAQELEQLGGDHVDGEHEQHDDEAHSEDAEARVDASAQEVEPAPAAEEAHLEAAPAPEAELAIRLEFAKSSNIRSATLDAAGVVAVEFRDGSIYRYANFTLELMTEWEAAKSAGSWFHNNVRTKPDRHPVLEG